MAFDLGRIRKEMAEAPGGSGLQSDLAAAILSDCFRNAGLAPPPTDVWRGWAETSHSLWREQSGFVARVLVSTSLGPETVAVLRSKATAGPVDLEKSLEGFFQAIKPLTAEMMRSNPFRQEECLRRWIATWGGAVLGEALAESARRLAQLDYRAALAEYARAEKARQAEAERRREILRKAAEREAAARGWRE